jgi:methyltransferase (TIGR00027 family)
MISEKGSATAVGAAIMRAAHQLIDGENKLLQDDIILQLLDPGIKNYILQNSHHFMEAEAMALRTHIVLRSRYAEDCLYKAFTSGITQYIILGAGFDSFAYRQPAWASGLRIFEMDHPDSQETKRKRLSEAGIPIPDNLHFGTINIETDDILSSFTNAGIDISRPVFIACLGVLVYLGKSAVDRLFKWIGSLAAGTSIVFTISRKQAMVQLSRAATLAANAGEPWITHFEPGELETALHACGFREISFLTPVLAEQLYFAKKEIRLPLPRKSSIVLASV